MPDDWLDKASGKWLTGPEVEEKGGLSGTILSLGEEKMNDGNVRPTLLVRISGRERVVGINAGAAEKIRGYLKGKPSSALVGKTIHLTTELARNPRTGITGPAVRIHRISA